MILSRIASALIAASTLAAGAMLAGCDAGPQEPQSIASEERVQEIVAMRKLFDKAGGKWEALTPEEQAEYTRLAGDAGKAQTMWKAMGTPMGSSSQ